MNDPDSDPASPPEVDPDIIVVEATPGVPPDPSEDSSADPSADPSEDSSAGSSDESGTRSGFGFEEFFDGEVFKRLKIEVDPDRVDESVERLTDQVRRAVVRGRYTKVRILYRGKPLMRDIPLGVFVAAEAVSFWYAGLLRALVVNLGARTVVEIVFVHEADEDVRQGRTAYEAGEVTEAATAFRTALKKEPQHQEALYRLGVLLRVTGQRDEALDLLEQAAALDGPLAGQARETLERMQRGPRTL